MSEVFVLDGVVVPREQAVVPVTDRGFLYGDSVFEVLRAYRGVLFAEDEHLARLTASAARLGIPLPAPVATLREELRRAAAALGAVDARVRLQLSRGDTEGVAPSGAGRGRRVVHARALQLSESLYTDGVRARTVVSAAEVDALHAPEAKTGNYLASVLALREAQRAGFDEAVRVTPQGRVLEASTANVWAVHGDAVTTPEGAGFLPGITRALLLGLRRVGTLTLREAPLSTADLWTADELFLSSSVREVVPVVALDDHEVGSGAPGPAARAIARAYAALRPASSLRSAWP